jgi:hypothetical protein
MCVLTLDPYYIKYYCLKPYVRFNCSYLWSFAQSVLSTLFDCKTRLLFVAPSLVRSVIQATFERIKHFSALLMKLLNKLTKEHIQAQSASPGFESGARFLTSVLEICQVSVSFLGEQRKYLLATLQGSDVGLNGAP